MIGVYKIVCIPTGRFYVGSSENIPKRKIRHLRDLRRGKHHNAFLQRVFDKYGEQAFKWKCKETESKAEAIVLEQHYLFQHMDDSLCMNIGVHASGGDNLTKNPQREEIVARIKETLRKQMASMTPEERRRVFGLAGAKNGMFGKKHTDAARALMADAVRSRDYSHLKGIPKSAEARKAMSEAAQRRVASEDYANGFAGRTHTDEVKQRIREKNLGKKPSNMRKIKVGKKIYASVRECANAFDVTAGAICYRLRSDKFPDYTYIT